MICDLDQDEQVWSELHVSSLRYATRMPKTSTFRFVALSYDKAISGQK